MPPPPLTRNGAGLTSLTRFAGFGPSPPRADDAAPLFRFGVTADPQYAPLPPWQTRHYANSLSKLGTAIDALNREDLQFVVTLGDLVEEGWENFAAVLPVYQSLRHPHVLLVGNHDFKVPASRLDAVRRMTGGPSAYYDFAGGGYRFVVVDATEISLFTNPAGSTHRAEAEVRFARLNAAGAANAQTWNGGLSETQFAWLAEKLDRAKAAGERVIVLSHYPVFPPHSHNSWDDARIVDLLSGYGNVVAFLCGHNHAGNYATTGGTHFVNFKGLVETPDVATYAIVDVHDDRLEIRGFGLEESRVLMI